MKRSSAGPTPGSFFAAVFVVLLTFVWTAAARAEEPKTETSSFFGLHKSKPAKKKAPSIPTLFSKPAEKKPEPVGSELTEEEKKMVEHISQLKAQAPAKPAEPPKAEVFKVKPRRPIWTPVLERPVVPVSPNRNVAPRIPKAPTKYLPNTLLQSRPAAPKIAPSVDPNKKKR